MMIATLCFLIKNKNNRPDFICLAMKKRGLGQGKWNGAGGKFDAAKDKSIKQAAIREVEEEIGVKVNDSIKKAGEIIFLHPLNKQDFNQVVHIYFSFKWAKEPIKSEEMLPKWFKIKDIPYKNMWPDDRHWLPMILQGKLIKARFVFDENENILEKEIKVVKLF